MQYPVKLDLNVKETLSSCLLGHKLRCPTGAIKVTQSKDPWVYSTRDMCQERGNKAVERDWGLSCIDEY